MRIRELQGRNVAIWGFGREGRSALKTLQTTLPELNITVLNDAPLPPEDVEKLKAGGASVITGDRVSKALTGFDVVVKSPGISRYRPDIVSAEARGVVFTSMTRIWFAENRGKKAICITGTKGKSTTSSLTAFLLGRLGVKAALAGNIGTPLFDCMDTTPLPDVYVVEMSSYQTSDFDGDPSVGVVLNLFAEHLDWHGSLEAYYRDKLNLLNGMTDGFKVINRLDKVTSCFPITGNVVYFNDTESFHYSEAGVYEGDKLVLPAGELKLQGLHNLSNVCAALTAVRCSGFNPAPCIADIGSFKGLPHRLTNLGERKGVRYVDDSISTTPQSAMAAVSSCEGRPVTIVLGGFDRGLAWEELAHFLVTKPVFAVVTVPETGIKIARAVREAIGLLRPVREPLLYEARDVVQAVEIASEITPPGGTVLLSPASPSYGEFRNFEERGLCFARAAGFSSV